MLLWMLPIKLLLYIILLPENIGRTFFFMLNDQIWFFSTKKEETFIHIPTDEQLVVWFIF